MKRTDPTVIDVGHFGDGQQQLQTLKMSSVCGSVDGQVAGVIGDVSVSSVFQQQRDDGRIPRGRRFVEDRGFVVGLGEDVCSCSTDDMLLLPSQ